MSNKSTNIMTAVGTKKSYFTGRNFYMYLLLIPALVCVVIFNYLPLAGLSIAFKDFDVIIGFFESPWVGLDNFKTIFTYPNFIKALKNTLVYSSVLLFGTFPFPILLAILFNELRPRGFTRVAQTLTYMPHFLSWVSVVGLFNSMFAIQGPVNDILAALLGDGYERVNIMLDSKYFLSIVFTSSVWKGMGWSSIIYLAAIAGIDPSLYEASSIDGCGRLRQTWHITLPAIRGTAVIILVMGIGSLMNTSFEQIYGLQNVYTQEDTEVLSTLIYRQGIQGGHYSLATAFGLFQAVVSLILVMTTNFVSKKLADISLW